MLLADVFVRHAGHRAGYASTEELDAELARLYETGRKAWTALSIEPAAYVKHVAERVPKDELLAGRALEGLHAADLYLACACVAGSPEAIRALDLRYITPLSSYLTRSHALKGFSDDVKQLVRERLLVSGRGAARIGDYTGQGSLKSWLRVAAVRVAINFRRTLHPEATSDDSVDDLLADAPDAEVQYLKKRYGNAFRGALEHALTKLTPREGGVLRLHFLDRMTAARIAALYRVSRRTIQRMLTDARHKLLAETHQRLRGQLHLSTTQFDTLLKLFHTEMADGLRRLEKKPRR